MLYVPKIITRVSRTTKRTHGRTPERIKELRGLAYYKKSSNPSPGFTDNSIQ